MKNKGIDWVYNLDDVLQFGKYKDEQIKLIDVIDEDPGYIDWCLENIDWFEIDNKAYEYLEKALKQYTCNEVLI